MKKFTLASLFSLMLFDVSAAQLYFIDTPIANQQKAQDYLSSEFARQYRFSIERRGNYGTYYSFMPLHQGKPVFNLVDSIAINKEKVAFRAYQSQITPAVPQLTWPSIEHVALTEIATLLKKPLASLQLNSATKGWWQTRQGLQPVWNIDLTYGDVDDRVTSHFMISADKESLLGQQGHIAKYRESVEVAASGHEVQSWLFNPDPKTSLMSDSLHSEYQVDKSLPNAAYRLVTLKDLTPVGESFQLDGPYVKVRDFIEPVEAVQSVPTQGPLNYNPESASFLQQMAYYHIDTAQRHLQFLGFREDKTIHYQPIVIDAQGSLNDQSAYSFYQHRILLGIGGRPDAQDADVIWHEYAHSITHFINPYEEGGDSGAIGEGFADFFAGAHSYRDEQGKLFEPDVMFNWDARFGNRTPRTLNDVNAQYNANYYYPAHVSVRGSLGDQLWSTPIFQSFKLAEQRYGEQGMDEMERIVIEAMYGLGAGVTMNKLALSTIDIAKRMYPTKSYSDDLQTAFARHNLLPKFINLTQADDITKVSGQDNLTLTVTNIGNTPLSNVTFTAQQHASFSLSKVTLSALDAGGTTQVSMPLQWLKGVTCGDDFSSKVTVNFDSSVPVINTEITDVDVVVGRAEQLNATGEGGVLKDATGTIGGAVTSNGISTFYLDVGNSETVIDKDFRLALDINHPDLQQVSIKLTSPSGRSVTVWNNAFYSQPRFNFELPSNINDVEFSVFYGEKFSGQWKLQIVDHVSSPSSDMPTRLNRWQLSQTKSYQCDSPVAPTPKPTSEPTSTKASSGGAWSWPTYLFIVLLAGWRAKKIP